MKTTIIIPARWNSSRFKGKVLAKIHEKTVLELVWEKANLSKYADNVVIATDNKKVENFCKKKVFKVIMTSTKHKTGTDRICEASKKINSDLYVNLQGDEPLINPKSIDKVINCLKKNLSKGYEVSTGYSVLDSNYKNKKKSCVFLVKAINNEVIFFSRSEIPSNLLMKNKRFKHIGLYALTKKALINFSRFKRGYLEINESIELLRFIENNQRIICTELNEKNLSVDYPSDINKIENILRKNN